MVSRKRARRSSWLSDSSAIRASPQPKRAAPNSIAAAIAVVPLVIPAYDILRPEGGPDRAADGAQVDPPVAQRQCPVDIRAGGVDRRTLSARPRRATDDPGIDE